MWWTGNTDVTRKQRVLVKDVSVTLRMLEPPAADESKILVACGPHYERLAGWDASGLDVLDVGCGYGLGGILLGVRGAKTVRFLDRSDTAVELATAAARDNDVAGTISGESCPWSELTAECRADLIVGNDVLYVPQSADELANLTTRVLRPGGVAMFSGCDRGHWDTLARALASHGLTYTRVDQEVLSSRRGTGVYEQQQGASSGGGDDDDDDDDGCEDSASLEAFVSIVATRPRGGEAQEAGAA